MNAFLKLIVGTIIVGSMFALKYFIGLSVNKENKKDTEDVEDVEDVENNGDNE